MRTSRGAWVDPHLASKQALGAADHLLQLLAFAHQLAVVRQPDDVASPRRFQLGEQVVIVAFTVHDMNGASGPAQQLFALPDGSSPAQRFALRVGTYSALVSVATRRPGPRPRLGPKHTERRTRGGHCDACVHEETANTSHGTDASEAIAIPGQHRQ